MSYLDIAIEMHTEGFSAKDIYTRLKEIFGDNAPAYSTITKKIRELVFLNPTSISQNLGGRPIDYINLYKVQKAIENSPNYTIRDIAKETGVPPTTVFRYLTKVLGYKNKSLRWIPHILTTELKNQRIQKSKDLLYEIQLAKINNYKYFITGDESWFYYTFNQNSKWVINGMPPGERVRRSFNNKKIMVVIFWSIDGIRLIDFIESNMSFNGDFFINNVLIPIKNSSQFIAAKKQKQSFFIHMDNSPIHRSEKVKSFLNENKFQVCSHPPYSPDLAPSDFFLFGTLKNHPGSITFDSPDDILYWIEEKFQNFSIDTLISVFNNWEERLKWVIDNNGNYYPQ